MKQTELQSTRQTSPRAVSATRFASSGATTPYAWKLVALLSLGGSFEIYNLGIDAWRFFTGIGLGLELVTIDTYIAELVPASVRGP